MQLIHSASEDGSDVRCPVCGQGFLLYWTRRSPQDQPVLASVLMEALGRQHIAGTGAEAHSREPLREMSSRTPLAGRFPDSQWGYC